MEGVPREYPGTQKGAIGKSLIGLPFAQLKLLMLSITLLSTVLPVSVSYCLDSLSFAYQFVHKVSYLSISCNLTILFLQ